MQHLEGSGTTVLYIGRTVLKGLFIFEPDAKDVLLFTYSELRKFV